MTKSSSERRIQILLQGCGIAVLIMLRLVWRHVSPSHSDLYHRMLPMNSVYGGVTIDLAVLCLLCICALWLLDRFDPDTKSLLWSIGGIFVVEQLSAFLVAAGFSSFGLRLLILVLIALGPLLWLWKRDWYSKAVRGTRVLLFTLGFCIFWILPQLTYMAIRPEPQDVHSFVKAVPQAEHPQRRVVWILFDELSQDQLFDHRQPDLSFPAFDQFRAQSTMFSDMQPAGFFTELVVPSLLWGHEVRGERSDLSGNLSVKTLKHGWIRFPANNTVFADAKRAGWSSGVAGWYNPYCRTYEPWLDWCAWNQRINPIVSGYLQDRSLLWNVNAPLLRTEAQVFHLGTRAPSNAVTHAQDYTELMQWSHQLIADEDIGFVFLHLPLPHPSGFYNRKTGQLGVPGSYLDNLALTDKTLAQLLQWIGETKLAPETTIILCSDHSWRVPLWKNQSTMWTREDARASQGKFDPRPVLMVRFPNQNTPQVISRSFSALKEHDLIETLLQKPMDADSLKNWVETQTAH